MLEALEAGNRVDAFNLGPAKIGEHVGRLEGRGRPLADRHPSEVDRRHFIVDTDDPAARAGEDLGPVARSAAEVEDALTRQEFGCKLVAVAMLGRDERLGARRLERQALDDVHFISSSRMSASISAWSHSRFGTATAACIESARTR